MELMIIFTTFLAVSIMVTAALNDKATVAILTFIIWFGLILIYSIQKPDSTVSLEISLPDNTPYGIITDIDAIKNDDTVKNNYTVIKENDNQKFPCIVAYNNDTKELFVIYKISYSNEQKCLCLMPLYEANGKDIVKYTGEWNMLNSVEELDIGMTTEGRDELEGLDR